MDALMLSRIQFAFTIGFHFIFVPISIGLALMVVLSERRYYKSDIPADKAASNFWIKLFTTTFAIGVATGLTMEFAFGTNWADYSRFVGSIFGAPLAAEGLLAFFLESTFLGVLLFGRKKRLQGLLLRLCVAGHDRDPAVGRVDPHRQLLAADAGRLRRSKTAGPSSRTSGRRRFNPSFAPRYVHTIVACVIAGCFVVAGICAWYLLKKRHLHFARQALCHRARRRARSPRRPCRSSATGTRLVVAEYQPVKMAAFENLDGDAEERAAVPVRLGERRRRHHRRQHPQRPEPDARPEPGPRGQGSRHRPGPPTGPRRRSPSRATIS